MELDRAHGLGHPEMSRKPRPIIVKFHRYKDREDVRAQANSMRNDLKSSNHGVGVQIPKEWRDARRRLYSIMQAERLKGNRVMKTKLYAAFLDWEKCLIKLTDYVYGENN